MNMTSRAKAMTTSCDPRQISIRVALSTLLYCLDARILHRVANLAGIERTGRRNRISVLVPLHRLTTPTARFWRLIVVAGSLGLQRYVGASSCHSIALLTLLDCVGSAAVLTIGPPFPPGFLKILRVSEYHFALLA